MARRWERAALGRGFGRMRVRTLLQVAGPAARPIRQPRLRLGAGGTRLGVDPLSVLDPMIRCFGTPVVRVCSTKPDGSPDLTPMSSAWRLGHSWARTPTGPNHPRVTGACRALGMPNQSGRRFICLQPLCQGPQPPERGSRVRCAPRGAARARAGASINGHSPVRVGRRGEQRQPWPTARAGARAWFAPGAATGACWRRESPISLVPGLR